MPSCDVSEVGEGETEVFSKEVAGDLLFHTVDDAGEAFVSLDEGIIVTGVGDYDVILGDVGDVG